jgi:hypothetical protein
MRGSISPAASLLKVTPRYKSEFELKLGNAVVSPSSVWKTPLVTVRLLDSFQTASLLAPAVQGVVGVAVVYRQKRKL